MKKILILAAMAILCHCAQAQRFDAAVWAGLNLSQIDGDESAHYNHGGLHAAVNTTFALRDLNSNWRMLVELGYTQKGSYKTQTDISTTLNYVELPLMLTYNRPHLRLGGGVAPGILVGGKVMNAGQELDINNYSFYKLDRLPLVADLSWHKGHLMLTARYESSMLSIIDHPGHGTYRLFRNNKGQFSRLIAFGVGYRF